MSYRAASEALARVLFFGVSCVSSIYALLCFLPFTWNNFVQAQFIPFWLSLFLHYHGGILLVVGGLAVLPFRRLWTRLLFGILVGLGGMAAIKFSWILSWRMEPWSATLSYFIWLPYVFWEGLLLAERSAKDVAATSLTENNPFPSIGSSDSWEVRVFLWAAVTSFLAYSWHLFHAWPVLLWVLAANLLFFIMLWASLELIRLLAKLILKSYQPEYSFYIVLLAVGFYGLVQSMILTELDYRGRTAQTYAMTFAAMVTLAWARMASLFHREHSHSAFGAVSRLLSPARRLWNLLTWNMRLPWIGLGLLLMAPTWVHWGIAGLDWNRLVESLVVIVTWAASVTFFDAWFLRNKARQSALSTWTTLITVFILVGTPIVANIYSPEVALFLTGKQLGPKEMAAEVLPLRLLRRFFRPPDEKAEFYALLQANTNLSCDTSVVPPDSLMGVPALTPLSQKPNIFIFVVDSLRPDYLGAYNPRIRFTPYLDSFAKDSLVFRRAFTVYGATGLSEPSIWAGSHLLHMQYVKPFSSLNNLEKLLEAEGYRGLISQDAILTEILKASTVTDPLDAKTTGHYKFCNTLHELTAKLQTLKNEKSPLFIYTQPQDLHISVRNREKPSVPKDSKFEGVFPPYASRIAAFDKCFGRFIQKLRSLGLYDNSIIIFTADHGDSLGESGRWGHAYTIYPEILRVPMIMHVPAALKQDKAWNTEAVSYLIDLTPTLYALLGWQLYNTNPLFGRTLIANSKEELEKSRLDKRLVVSSYGPVYGILENEGQHLHIADAVNFTSYDYDLSIDPLGQPLSISREERRANHQHIEEWILRINSYFNQ